MDIGFAVYPTIRSVQSEGPCDDLTECIKRVVGLQLFAGMVLCQRSASASGLPGPKFSFPPQTLPFFSFKAELEVSQG
jgi:hypothetical protein